MHTRVLTLSYWYQVLHQEHYTKCSDNNKVWRSYVFFFLVQQRQKKGEKMVSPSSPSFVLAWHFLPSALAFFSSETRIHGHGKKQESSAFLETAGHTGSCPRWMAATQLFIVWTLIVRVLWATVLVANTPALPNQFTPTARSAELATLQRPSHFATRLQWLGWRGGVNTFFPSTILSIDQLLRERQQAALRSSRSRKKTATAWWWKSRKTLLWNKSRRWSRRSPAHLSSNRSSSLTASSSKTDARSTNRLSEESQRLVLASDILYLQLTCFTLPQGCQIQMPTLPQTCLTSCWHALLAADMLSITSQFATHPQRSSARASSSRQSASRWPSGAAVSSCRFRFVAPPRQGALRQYLYLCPALLVQKNKYWRMPLQVRGSNGRALKALGISSCCCT